MGLASHALAQRSAVVNVPMLFYGTRPAVEVKVNGQGPFLFLIDTGAQGIARVDVSLVERLNLPIIGQSSGSDAESKTAASLKEVKLDRLLIGSLEFSNLQAFSRNYNSESYLPHLYGILGFDLFKDYLLTLDYPNRRVIIEKGSLPAADGRQILKFEMIDGNPYVDIAIGSRKTKALIDSGNIRFLDLSSSSLRTMPLASYPKLIGKSKSISGEFDVKEVSLQDALFIGAFSFKKPMVTFSDEFSEINIGSSLWRDFAITFDRKHLRFRLRKSQ